MKPERPPLSRRDALKRLAGSAAGAAALPAIAAQNETEPAPASLPLRDLIHDPDFSKASAYPWPKQFTPEELKTTSALADLILPKDSNGPAAGDVGVPEFINEWCSAPYDDYREDGQVIRGGLAWLNTESFNRHEKRFDELTAVQQTQILDDICDEERAQPEHRTGARFFKEFRRLCLGGYYTHSATWKHLGYVGNISIAGPYPGVPQEIIEKLGLQDVA
jgi:hypothetical protein